MAGLGSGSFSGTGLKPMPSRVDTAPCMVSIEKGRRAQSAREDTMTMNRRSLIGAAGLALTAPALQVVQAADGTAPTAAPKAAAPPPVTRTLAKWILASNY